MNWKLRYRVIDREYERRGKEIERQKKKLESYKKCMKIIDEFVEKFGGKNVQID